MKKVYATLRALVEVMEVLSKDGATDGVGRLIAEEVSLNFSFSFLKSYNSRGKKPLKLGEVSFHL